MSEIILKKDDLNDYGYNVYSQNGEDGIIEEIIRRLRIDKNKNKFCVEFGAWDGMYLSNTFNLINKGWKGIYIEGDEKKYQDLLKTSKIYPNITPVNKFVSINPKSKNSLDLILKNYKIPRDFEILSIDIDSFDLEVWLSLYEYKPKIIIIEINSTYPPGIIKWHSGKYNNSRGNSFSATLKVGIDKGYSLICHCGNMIFLRNDLTDQVNINEKFLNYPELLFNDLWYSIEKNTLLNIYIHTKAFLMNKIILRMKRVFIK